MNHLKRLTDVPRFLCDRFLISGSDFEAQSNKLWVKHLLKVLAQLPSQNGIQPVLVIIDVIYNSIKLSPEYFLSVDSPAR